MTNGTIEIITCLFISHYAVK